MSTTIVEHVKFSELPRNIRDQIPEKEGRFLLHIVPEEEEQAYFWTKEWQQGEWEADEDKKTGRVSGPFDSVASLKSHLLD